MKNKFYIFYSWQADVPGNRNFIDKKIKEAIAEISEMPEMNGIEIMHDDSTKNRSGSPSIVETIHEKINLCDVFIADVTPITSIEGKGEDGREKLIPNPNVMTEAGFALRAIGDKRIVLLMSVDSGKIEDLPFDIRHRRITPFPTDPQKRKKFSLKPMILEAIKYSQSYQNDFSLDKEMNHDTQVFSKLSELIGNEREFLNIGEFVASHQKISTFQYNVFDKIVEFILEPKNMFIIPELKNKALNLVDGLRSLTKITGQYFSPSYKEWNPIDPEITSNEVLIEAEKTSYYVWIDKAIGQRLPQEQYDREEKIVIYGLGEACVNIEKAYSEFRKAIKTNLYI